MDFHAPKGSQPGPQPRGSERPKAPLNSTEDDPGYVLVTQVPGLWGLALAAATDTLLRQLKSGMILNKWNIVSSKHDVINITTSPAGGIYIYPAAGDPQRPPHITS